MHPRVGVAWTMMLAVTDAAATYS